MNLIKIKIIHIQERTLSTGLTLETRLGSNNIHNIYFIIYIIIAYETFFVKLTMLFFNY